jgi:Toprim domain
MGTVHTIPPNIISDVVERLAANAEAVCRNYLPNGRRQGRYWHVGDVHGAPGRSLYVRLRPSGKGAAGKWTDSATGEHGDLLDIIRIGRRLRSFPDAIDEARQFLGMPQGDNTRGQCGRKRNSTRPQDSAFCGHKPGVPEQDGDAATASKLGGTISMDLDLVNAARRLFMASIPINGTLAEIYLHKRGITDLIGLDALRFHPACLYPEDEDADRNGDRHNPHGTSPDICGPALIAAVSDADGWVTGVQRTWLDAGALVSDESLGPHLGKAIWSSPRRALGALLGGGVRFGPSSIAGEADVLLAGEGVETMLSLRMVLPGIPMIAALSAAHLAAILFPTGLNRLYIAQDNDRAGRAATAKLRARASNARIEAIALSPILDDFNTDLLRFGAMALSRHIRHQLCADDAVRFWASQGRGRNE